MYQPVNQAELELIAASGWRGFPPRLPEQPIFYPVQNVGDAQHTELWVPAERLADFNQHIIGLIEVTATFRR